jgi:Tfp pilus assembly protein PilX
MKKTKGSKCKGSVLIISMIFLVLFSALAVSMAALSTTNLIVAQNHCTSDGARACAESGLEVIRYWMSRASISGTTSPSERFNQFAASIQSELTDAAVTNLSISYDGSTLSIPSVALNNELDQSFSATVTQIDDDIIQVDVTGTHGSITSTIRTHYLFGTRANTVFDFGVASRGPLSLSGNIDMEGANISVESNAYIESDDSILALTIIGNSHIAGNVKIVNPIATVDLQGGQAGIGGETGQDAIDNHVEFGVPPSEFPEPVPSTFASYATNIVDANTDTSTDVNLENITIAAGTNPTFSGQATLKGIVFIETPNVVTFTGDAHLTAIIVGSGDWTDNSGTNQINFSGNVESLPVSELPAEVQFEGLHDQTGTFIIAPGFHVSFTGNFTSLSGAIAGNGIEFSGNAGGTINGSIINYSSEEATLSGNTDLYFNRSGIEEIPAGFVPEIILQYDPDAYSEVTL